MKNIFWKLFSKKYWYNGLLQNFRVQLLLALLLILLIATITGLAMTFLSSSDALSQKFYNRFFWGFFQTIDSGSIPETIGIMNSGANDSLWHSNAIVIISIACFSWVLGSIVFNLITSAFTNFLDLRRDALAQGLVRYKFKEHAIIIGWDFQGIAIINQIRKDMGDCTEIVIMSNQETSAIRQHLRKELSPDVMHNIYIYHGIIECDESLEEKGNKRLSELEMLYPQFAKVIYILGEPDNEQRSAANRKLAERINHIIKNTFATAFFMPDFVCSEEVSPLAKNLVSLCSKSILFKKLFSVVFDYSEKAEKNYFYSLALESAQEGNLNGHNIRYYELLLHLKMVELEKPSYFISKLYVYCFRKISTFAKKLYNYPTEPIVCYMYLTDELAFKLSENYDIYDTFDCLIISPFNFYRDKAFYALADTLHSSMPLAFRKNTTADHVHIIITNFNEMAKAIILQASKSIFCRARSHITLFSQEYDKVNQFLITNRLYNLNCVDFDIVEASFESTIAIQKLNDILCDITASVTLVITNNIPLAALQTYCALPDFCKYKKFRILIEAHMEQDFKDIIFAENSKLPTYEIIGQISAPSSKSYWNVLQNGLHGFLKYPIFSEQNIHLYTDDILALFKDCMPEICAMQKTSFSNIEQGNSVKQAAWEQLSPDIKFILEKKIPDFLALNKINNDYSISDFPHVDNLLKFVLEFPEICRRIHQFMPKQANKKLMHVSTEAPTGICGYIFSETHQVDDTDDCFEICSCMDKINERNDGSKGAKSKLLFCPNSHTIKNLFMDYFKERDFYLVLPCLREEYAKQLPSEILEDYQNCCLNADDIFVVDQSVPLEHRMEAVDAFIAEHSDFVICNYPDAEKERQKYLHGKYSTIKGCYLRETTAEYISRKDLYSMDNEQESC